MKTLTGATQEIAGFTRPGSGGFLLTTTCEYRRAAATVDRRPNRRKCLDEAWAASSDRRDHRPGQWPYTPHTWASSRHTGPREASHGAVVETLALCPHIELLGVDLGIAYEDRRCVGRAQAATGLPREALASNQQALRLYREVGDRGNEAVTPNNAGAGA
jgi:hypothetical protein